MRVLLFGTYDVAAHPRVAVLRDGLRAHGIDVVECNAPLGLSTAARVRLLRQPWRLPALTLMLARRWTRLARMARTAPTPDAVLVGYLGHFDVHLARRLFPQTPIVLDHLVSGAATARDRGTSGGLRQAALRALDRAALHAADLVVVDTEEHRADLPDDVARRALTVPVGATQEWFGPLRPGTAGPLKVIFFGLFTPLQGAVTIGHALARLGPGVEVTMVGHGQDLDAARVAARTSAAQVTWLDWVPNDQLPTLVAEHDVCLGIFGRTDKAGRVVPTKVYQGAAAGCALITSDTPPQRRTLGDAALLVPPGDPIALAAAIQRLAADRGYLTALQIAAGALAQAEFTPRGVVAPLEARLRETPRVPTIPALPPLTATGSLRWAALQDLLPAHGTDVLDIGCGQAGIGARLAARYQHYLGLDTDPQSAAVARDRVAPYGGEIRTASTDTLRADEQFDLLCAFEVIEHLDDDLSALRGWLAHLRGDGTALVSVPAYQHRFGPSDILVGHLRRYSPNQLRRLLENSGLQDVVVRHYAFPSGYALEAIRHRVAARALAAQRTGTSDAERTAASGRTFQPSARPLALAYRAAAFPARLMQHRFPHRGTSLVASGRLPG